MRFLRVKKGLEHERKSGREVHSAAATDKSVHASEYSTSLKKALKFGTNRESFQARRTLSPRSEVSKEKNVSSF